MNNKQYELELTRNPRFVEAYEACYFETPDKYEVEYYLQFNLEQKQDYIDWLWVEARYNQRIAEY